MTNETEAALLTCGGCGAGCEPDSNFCDSCGAKLRPVWACPQCGGDNRLGALACGSCGWLHSPRRLPPWQRCGIAAALAFLAASVLAIGWRIGADIRAGRHVLSTKDGRFLKEAPLGK